MSIEMYRSLIERKRVTFNARGLTSWGELPASLFPHQVHGVEFALRAGCAALFYDTGLGKTAMALAWGDQIVRHTNKPVLMLAPLAVGPQHVREADRLGIDAKVIRDGSEVTGARIYVLNYDRLDRIDASQFGGVILDESSILKSFSGQTTRALIAMFAHIPYRLCCTATPAPNDHTELGTHAEFLGVMRRDEMLPIWFIHDSADTGTWRIKGHAQDDFWGWASSWARCVSSPSDVGFDDAGFILPELVTHRHEVRADTSLDTGAEKDGQSRLFRIPENSATSIHKEKRLTCVARVRLATDIILGDWGCLGSRNTLPPAAPNINLIQQSANVGLHKGAPLSKTQNTCATITPKIEKSGGVAPKGRQRSTDNGKSDTLLIPCIASNASNTQEPDAPRNAETDDCLASSVSVLPNTERCSTDREAGAPYAATPSAAREENASQSIIVTEQDEYAACSAQTATKGSVSSQTTLIASDALPNMSSDRDCWVIWCDTDYEQDELDRAFGDLAISIRGSHSSDLKESLHSAWLRGERKILICKPVMFGYGLNWQHCCKMFFVGLSFSYESYYQAVRRSWRFGQTRPVHVHIACADTERAVYEVVTRKAEDHGAMKESMRRAMREASNERKAKVTYQPKREAALPAWLAA